MQNLNLSEHDEAVLFADYLEIMLNAGKIQWYTKTAQETWTPGFKQKHKNKSEGVKSGLPDYIIIINNNIIWIELKKVFCDKWNYKTITPYTDNWEKSRGLSDNQINCIKQLYKSKQNIYICYGANACIDIVDMWINLITKE